MKRILCLLFLILCGFSLIGGGTFLLSGCSSSQTETGGGGTSSPSEDEENPGDGEGGDVSPDANTEFSWTVKGIYRTSST